MSASRAQFHPANADHLNWAVIHPFRVQTRIIAASCISSLASLFASQCSPSLLSPQTVSENKLSPGTAEWALTEAIADLPSVPISDKYLVVSLATVNYYPFNNKEKRLLIRCRVKAFKL